jgi:hypothetical protein
VTQTEDIPLSTNVKVKATFYQEPAHTPFDPTAVTVQAMKPDGTVVTGLTAAHEGTGIWSAVIFTDQHGRAGCRSARQLRRVARQHPGRDFLDGGPHDP